MTIINRNALVSYSVRQMYELVNMIEDYPHFLPWCGASHIISRSEHEVQAALDITWKGMSKSFSTRNVLHPYDRIEITLINGPFKHLEGCWSFVKLDNLACKVCLDLEFEFAGGVMDVLFQPIFNHIANSLVDAFCKRAVEVYGQS
jgi:ribosome-associated toxin RatA of RatAB toxin-antitoxin module